MLTSFDKAKDADSKAVQLQHARDDLPELEYVAPGVGIPQGRKRSVLEVAPASPKQAVHDHATLWELVDQTTEWMAVSPNEDVCIIRGGKRCPEYKVTVMEFNAQKRCIDRKELSVTGRPELLPEAGGACGGLSERA